MHLIVGGQCGRLGIHLGDGLLQESQSVVLRPPLGLVCVGAVACGDFGLHVVLAVGRLERDRG